MEILRGSKLWRWPWATRPPSKPQFPLPANEKWEQVSSSPSSEDIPFRWLSCLSNPGLSLALLGGDRCTSASLAGYLRHGMGNPSLFVGGW